MIQGNYFADNGDLQLHFDTLVNWDEVVSFYENGFIDAAAFDAAAPGSWQAERLSMAPHSVAEAVEYYRQILEGFGEFWGNEAAPLAQSMDQLGLKFERGKVTHPQPFVDVVKKFHETGLHPIAFLRRFGGLGVPHVLKAMAFELAYRADTSMTIAAASVNLAGILEMYASEELCEEWIPKLIEGGYVVTMGLSEPDFGSDLPSVRTKAEFVDGRWLLTGTKRFQTVASGINEIPSVLLALARTGDAGARGLSFFLVEGKDVQISGIEKKLGLKASATCEVVLEQSPGILIGEKGYGLSRYVIGMLNGARLSVASQGTGIAMAAFKEAQKYASERIQFGRPIAELPAVARMLRRMDVEIKAMRCLMVEAALSVDRYHWAELRARFATKPGDREQKGAPGETDTRKWEKIASILTPISKYYISESCNAVVYEGLQVLGGAGYTEEYDLARLYRDARITNIYDGTTQIQVNAAIGGVVAGVSAKGHLREYIDEQFAALSGENERLTAMRQTFEDVVALYKDLPDADTKGRYAFEVVQSAARLLCSLFLEKTAGKLSGEAREERLQIAGEYQTDSEAILAGNRIKLERA